MKFYSPVQCAHSCDAMPRRERSSARSRMRRRAPIVALMLVCLPFAVCRRLSAAAPPPEQTTSTPAPVPVEQIPSEETIAEIQSRFLRTGKVDQKDVVLLTARAARYPDDQTAPGLLKRILVSREDWNALVTLCSRKPLEQQSETEKLELAKVLIKAQRFEEALVPLDMLIADHGENIEYHWLHGYADYYCGDYAGAIKTFEQYRQQLIEAGRTTSILLCGLSHFQLDQMDRAIEELSDYVRRAPNDLSGCNGLARALVAVGRDDEAEPLFERVTKLHEQYNVQEKKQLMIAARIREINDACRQGRLQACEESINLLLPDADGQLKVNLLLKLADIYAATDRPDQARSVREEATKLGQ